MPRFSNFNPFRKMSWLSFQVSLDEKIPVDFNSYYHLCNYERCLIEISSFLSRVINGNPYTFLSFAESKLKLGAEFPVEPPVIRLICHNDEKFLFVNDVKTAMAKVSSDRKKQQFPRGMFLKISDSHDWNFRFFGTRHREEHEEWNLPHHFSLQVPGDHGKVGV